MVEKTDLPERKRFGLRDVSGTTVAVATLAVLGAAAIVSAPLWVWYRRKRKRTDALASNPPAEAPPIADATREEAVPE